MPGLVAASSTILAQQQAPKTLWQICRIREAQIVEYNKALNKTNMALTLEKNRVQQDKLVADIAAITRGLETSEQSWQRMDCSRLLYPNPQTQGR